MEQLLRNIRASELEYLERLSILLQYAIKTKDSDLETFAVQSIHRVTTQKNKMTVYAFNKYIDLED